MLKSRRSEGVIATVCASVGPIYAENNIVVSLDSQLVTSHNVVKYTNNTVSVFF